MSTNRSSARQFVSNLISFWSFLSTHKNFSDPYVKVWLMFGDKRVEKKKTPVYKCNLNPIFNATFEFDVPWEQIRDCALDIQVMDFDTVGRNELIGRLCLGCEFSKENLKPLLRSFWRDPYCGKVSSFARFSEVFNQIPPFHGMGFAPL